MEQDSTEIGTGSWNRPPTGGLQVAKPLDDVLHDAWWLLALLDASKYVYEEIQMMISKTNV